MMNGVMVVFLITMVLIAIAVLFGVLYLKYPFDGEINKEDSILPIPDDGDEREVFHVAGELVGYDDANDVCKQYGATLATYDQLVDAYQKGAEWCNYGWSENQTAYYPTQKHTWEKIQNAENEKDRSMCGVPGLNGGKFDKDTRLNVNCYGRRPQRPDPYFKHPELPKTLKNKSELQLFDDLVVVPYSRKQWSQGEYEPAKV